MNRRSNFLHWSAGIAIAIMSLETAHIVKESIHHDDNCIMTKFSLLAMGIFLATIVFQYITKRRK